MRSGRVSSWLLRAGLACLCAVAWPARAGEVATPAAVPALRDYAIDTWTSREGLPHNTIRSIAQTADERMWFGTWEGVVAYNGLEFTLLDRSTSPGLPDNGIGELLADGDALWISDSRGNLTRRDGDGRLQVHLRPAHAPKELIGAMTTDPQGQLWLAYQSKGLARVSQAGEFRYFPAPPGSPLTDGTLTMAHDGQRLWIGTSAGLVYAEADGVPHAAPRSFGLPAAYVWPYLAADGGLWIAAEDHLYRMQDGKPRLVYTLPSSGRITALLQDHRGQLWVGTETNGLLRAGAAGLEPFPGDASRAFGRIKQIFEDAEGSLWAGASGGLFRLRETLFHSYTRADGLSSNYVRAVVEDRRGRLWIGTSAGLDRMEADGSIHSQALPIANGQPASVFSLAEDAAGRLWVGTSFGDGLYRLDPNGRVQRYGAAEGIPSGNNRAIVAEGEDTIWLGSQIGLVRLDVRSGKGELAAPEAEVGQVMALALEPDGLWVGGRNGVSVLRDGRVVERFGLAQSGDGNTVFGFRRLGTDMWIASDRGLYRHRAGRLARVGMEQGMPVDTVFHLLPDGQGNVWITSNRGVLRTTHAALDAVADGRVAKIAMLRHDEIDGMANAQANGGFGPAGWVRRDGTLWVATAGGLAMVDPVRIRHLAVRPPPPSVIERVAVDGQPLQLSAGEHWLPIPGGKRLSVDYVGLSYVLSDRIRYRTRLDGLDAGWVERGRQHTIEYVGLAPGEYTLHVSAAPPGGAWSEREAVLRLRVQPLWWQRLDVRMAGGVLVLLALFALYAYRTTRLRAANERLLRLVDERTRDIRQADVEKSVLLERLREASEAFERQSREDELTGLPNRRAFQQELHRQVQRSRCNGQPLVFAMMDIDHFKQVNDLHSHAAGDRVLQEVGRLLREGLRAGDLPARLGGEEFGLLLVDTSLEQAARLCERLRERFHAHRDWGTDGLHITFSAGLAQWQGGNESETQWLQHADAALYQAKQQGRDRIIVA